MGLIRGEVFFIVTSIADCLPGGGSHSLWSWSWINSVHYGRRSFYTRMQDNGNLYCSKCQVSFMKVVDEVMMIVGVLLYLSSSRLFHLLSSILDFMAYSFFMVVFLCLWSSLLPFLFLRRRGNL